MDSVMMRQFSPTSSMFQTSATQNFANVGASSVRNQKDVAPQQEEDQNSILDNVNISMPDAEELDADDAVNNAAISGALADIAEDDDEGWGDEDFPEDEDIEYLDEDEIEDLEDFEYEE